MIAEDSPDRYRSAVVTISGRGPGHAARSAMALFMLSTDGEACSASQITMRLAPIMAAATWAPSRIRWGRNCRSVASLPEAGSPSAPLATTVQPVTGAVREAATLVATGKCAPPRPVIATARSCRSSHCGSLITGRPPKA